MKKVIMVVVRVDKMKQYNLIPTREGIWKLEEVGIDKDGNPYIKHIRLGTKESLEKIKKELKNGKAQT